MRCFLSGLINHQINQIGAKCVQRLKLRNGQNQGIVVMGMNRELITLAVSGLSLQ